MRTFCKSVINLIRSLLRKLESHPPISFVCSPNDLAQQCGVRRGSVIQPSKRSACQVSSGKDNVQMRPPPSPPTPDRASPPGPPYICCQHLVHPPHVEPSWIPTDNERSAVDAVTIGALLQCHNLAHLQQIQIRDHTQPRRVTFELWTVPWQRDSTFPSNLLLAFVG